MKSVTYRLVAIGIFAAEIMLVGLPATSAAAQSAAQERRLIKQQQQLIAEQQRRIRSLESQSAPTVQRSPVTGEPIDQRTLPKGLLSGILPECPLGFAYNPFVGCVLYVAH